MDKKYNHLIVEQGKHQKWIDHKYFSTHDQAKKPFTIILPPPNVTGQLHLGHAWNSYWQDAMIRFKKLRGYDVLWLPAMDHAGIATQAKVEQQLQQQGTSRHELGRAKFIDQVWAWKDLYSNRIMTQWAQLGLALDFASTRFTLDDKMTTAVQTAFMKLYDDGLIYRGKRPVNWDPKLQTVLSNIEVETQDVSQPMYYIKYDLVDKATSVVIATVRPETLFSDVALAVNPADQRHAHLIGQRAQNPLTQKVLPIFGDETIALDKGTGIMKVSAHSELDFAIIKQHNLPIIECIDRDGKMNDQAQQWAGLDRFKARKQIAAHLESGGRIERTEPTVSALGVSTRSGAYVETLVQKQWFVKMKPLANYVLASLDKQEITFYPPRFAQTLERWMNEVHDWCISRQLWWGHRLPVWYRDKAVKVQVTSPGPEWVQEEDVLDTWFSSALAPFAFLGWPEQDARVARYFPTDVLVTGYDIIFFWVARMYFQAKYFLHKIPFRAVVVHGLIRDAKGRKMSKSLNNGIDPMTIIAESGSDALRWFLLTNATPGQDLKFSEAKIAAGWNLCNKIWNIARYIFDVMAQQTTTTSQADIWINNKLAALQQVIVAKMATHELTIIGKAIHKFISEDFSSWYVELSKTRQNQQFAQRILLTFLQTVHPFLPFLTDHIFSLTNQELLATPLLMLEHIKPKQDLSRTIDLVKILRAYRHDHQISAQQLLHFSANFKLAQFELAMINKLAHASWAPNHDIVLPYHQHQIYIQASLAIKARQKAKLTQQIATLEFEIKRAQTLLNNARFVAKAPAAKIAMERDKLAQYQSELATLLQTKARDKSKS